MGYFSGAYANAGYSGRYTDYSSRNGTSYANRTNRGTLTKMAEYNMKKGYTDNALRMLEDANIPVNSSIFNTIQQNTDNSLVTGLKEGVPVFGLFANSNSDSEAAAKLTNTEMPIQEVLLEKLGAAASGAASGAAMAAGLGLLCGGPFAPLASTAGAIGGAIIGGVTGIARTFFG